MNATDFFTEAMFYQLKNDISSKKVFPLTETPYRTKVKVNNNSYELAISASHYSFGDKEYHFTGWVDHAYTHNGHREIGGGNYLKVVLDSYQAFKDGINKTLEKFPDYVEDVWDLQLCLF